MDKLFVFINDSINKIVARKANGLKNMGLIAIAKATKNRLPSKNRLGMV